jgi:hypothetical protein
MLLSAGTEVWIGAEDSTVSEGIVVKRVANKNNIIKNRRTLKTYRYRCT